MTPLGWPGTARLGLVQAALGAMVVLVTSTLNRVMVVEYALPALVPGALVALHYTVQVSRPLLGYGSDLGGRRTRWIVGGIATMGLGSVGAACAVLLVPAHPIAAIALAAVAFAGVGLGVGAAGTSLLTLMAARVAPARRPAAAATAWIMMIAGIALTATAAGRLLDPFSPARLLAVTAGVACLALVLSLVGVWRIEGEASPAAARSAPQPFLPALREIWAEPQARRFAQFVFVSMLAYSAEELVLEPCAGAVFGFTPGQSAGLTGAQHGGVLVGMLLVAAATALAGFGRERAMRFWTVGGCVASGLAALGVGACAAVGPGAPLQAAATLLGLANGVFAVSAIGAMMGLAAQGRAARAGTRMGLWGAAQALAFGAGGLVGTGASDLARLLLGDPRLAYATVFSAEALLFIAAATLAGRVFPSTQPAPIPPGVVAG